MLPETMVVVAVVIIQLLHLHLHHHQDRILLARRTLRSVDR
jgi:hypothetical protein